MAGQFTQVLKACECTNLDPDVIIKIEVAHWNGKDEHQHKPKRDDDHIPEWCV